jgi:UDP-glucuronate 4-epimerase
MKYFITGINGFIGFSLAKKLVDLGHTVSGIDDMNKYYDIALKVARQRILEDDYEVNVHHGSIVKKHDAYDMYSLDVCIKHEKPDVVIHLAGYAGIRNSIENPETYISSNISGTQNVIDVCEKYGIQQVLYASTSSVMANNTVLPWTEDERLGDMLSPYAYSKQVNEHQFKMSNIPTTTGLRFFTVYGPWGRPDMALFHFTKQIIAGEPIDVYNYGDMKRDFTYIDDIVEGIIALLELIPNSVHEIYNIGYGKQVGLMDFIKEIESNLGRTAQMNLLPMHPADSKETWSNTTKLRDLTGWEPKTNVVDGVKQFIDWYKSFYNVN